MSTFSKKCAPYIAIGWHVAPMRPGTSDGYFAKKGNEDLGPDGGFHWATDDPDRIAEYERRFGPNCNLVLKTGRVSNVVCVDVDFGKSNVDARASIEYLASQGKTFPETAKSRTRSGGEHWFYRYRGPLRKSVGLLGMMPGIKSSGIDVMADGGNCALPPTSTPQGSYEWIVEPFGMRLPLLPRWVMQDMAPPPTPRTYRPTTYARNPDMERVQWRLDIVRDAPPRTANDTLYRMYAQALDYGHTPSQIRAAFEAAALDRNIPIHEIRDTLNQAERPSNRREPRRRSSGHRRTANASRR